MSLFQAYASVSGQIISVEKSKFFTGTVSAARISIISNLLGFSPGYAPISYLGVPLFKGRPKKVHLMPIADKIRIKLSS